MALLCQCLYACNWSILLQDETRIGDYPLMNVYANFHLKRTRFFLMYYNISDLFLIKGIFYRTKLCSQSGNVLN